MENDAGAFASPLPRVIGTGRFALIIVGLTIGTAIFRVPSLIAANAGSPEMTAAVWLVGACFALAGGVCAAELGSRLPGAGGEYALGKAIYGDRFGFVFGVTWLLLVSPASIAAVARAFSDYAAVFTPLSEGSRRMLTAVVIALHTAMAMASTRIASRFIGIATVAKLAAMGLVVLAAMALSGSPIEQPPLPASAGSAGAVIAALVAVIWAYDGSAQIMLAGDVKDPERSIPRGLMLAAGIVVVVYFLLNAAYGRTLGFQGLAVSTAVAADTMQALVGRVGALLVAGLVLLSAYSCGMAQLVGHPRITFGLANDGLFWGRFASLSRGPRTPWLAILLHGALACLLSVLGGYEFLIRLVVFAFYPLLATIYVGAIVLRRREGLPRGFRMPFFPIPIVFYLLMLSVVMVVSLLADPKALLYAGAVMAVAAVGSRLVRPRQASPAAEITR
jgi:APA family basic amino acid/polyamine antiporter